MTIRRIGFVLIVLGLFLGLAGSGYAQSGDQSDQFEPPGGPFGERPPENGEPVGEGPPENGESVDEGLPEHIEPIDAPIVEEAAGFPILVAQADLIIIGSVSTVKSKYGTNEWGDQLIVSNVSVALEETLKGNAGDARKVVFRGIAGGTVDGTTMRSSDTPLFIEGERVVLMLMGSPEAGYTVVGGDAGKLEIDAAGNVPQLGRTLDQFRGDLQAILSGQPLEAPAEQMSPEQDSGADSPSILGTDGTDYVYNGQRWPGTSPVVPFRINNPGFNDSGAGTVAQQTAELTAAAGTWTNTGGARFGFNYLGTTTISATGADGQHVVIVRNATNPNNANALATATWWLNDASTQITNCDIVFWDAPNRFTAIGTTNAFDIRTVAIHEFGHCLGLGHSTIGGSIMWPSLAAGTINRTLRADDLAGVRAIYGVAGASTLWTSGYGYNGGWRINQHPRMMADVNGDGRDDVVGFASAGVYVSTSSGSGFSAPKLWVAQFGYSAGGWRVENHPRMMADVNGDGRDDVVGFANAGVYVATSKGTGFNTPSFWSTRFGYTTEGWRVDRHPRFMADVNGDGRADVVGFSNSGVQVAISTGTAFSAASYWSTAYGYNAGWRVNMHPRMMADVNGDGRDDVVGFAGDGVYVSTSTGSGFTAPKLWVAEFGYSKGGWRVENHPRMMADVNGDGRDDVVGFASAGVYVATSKGTGFNAPSYWSRQFGYSAGSWRVAQHPRFVTDVNGDGRADVVGFANGGVYVARSLGTSFDSVHVPWVSAYGYSAGSWRVENHPRMMADVNGDGRADVVGFGNAGVLVSRSAVPPNVFR